MTSIKHLGITIVICLASVFPKAQQPLLQIKITEFTSKTSLPPSIKNWGRLSTDTWLAVKQTSSQFGNEAKLSVNIKKNEKKICGSNWDDLQILNFSGAKAFSPAELSKYLQGCQSLGSGSYTLCVQFFNVDHYPISEERCANFTVL